MAAIGNIHLIDSAGGRFTVGVSEEQKKSAAGRDYTAVSLIDPANGLAVASIDFAGMAPYFSDFAAVEHAGEEQALRFRETNGHVLKDVKIKKTSDGLAEAEDVLRYVQDKTWREAHFAVTTVSGESKTLKITLEKRKNGDVRMSISLTARATGSVVIAAPKKKGALFAQK